MRSFIQLIKNKKDDIPLLGRYPSDIYDGNQFVQGNPWVLITNALAEYYYSLAKIYETQNEIKITKRSLLFFKQITHDAIKAPGTITAQNDPEQFQLIVASLKLEGDKALQTVKKYSACYADNSCLHFAEQIDAVTGKPTSAKDLTWGYVTVLSAMEARG